MGFKRLLKNQRVGAIVSYKTEASPYFSFSNRLLNLLQGKIVSHLGMESSI
jgi:hypothetical protein